MEKHFELTDAEFEQQFSTCKLNPDLFSHEAHLRLAWIHIKQYGLTNAENNIQEQLQNYVIHLGATDKYHHTLTIAAIRAVNYFVQLSNTVNFNDFITEFPQLKTNFKQLIDSHYSIDIFSSEKAKKNFIEPDLAPF